MGSNILIKMVAVILVVAAVAITAMKMNGNDAKKAQDVPTVGGEEIDEETRIAIGLEGDTPQDTVKTLISNVRSQKDAMRRLELDNAELRDANTQLVGMEENIAQKLQAELQSKTNELQSANTDALTSTRLEIQGLLDRFRANSANLSVPTATGGPPALTLTHPGATVDSEGTVWVPPLGVATQSQAANLLRGRGLASLPFDAARSGGPADLVSARNQLVSVPVEAPAIPAYTIAKNSTLVGATAFTALVGRVPVGENVVDPYSFKVIIGKDNLIANGKKVPELAYAVVSGKAIGDWTLSCVSGKVYSITFVFEDGRIRTLPKPKDISDGSQTTQDLKIGELSDDFGNPCVVGTKISNASKYLYQRVLATAAEAAARAAAAAETTTTVAGFGGLGVGGTTVVDGNKGKFVIDETLAGAANEAAQWVRDRQSLEFDAVYVRPGAKVAIHITEELRIDYEETGRFTHHAGFALRGKHRELD